MTLNSKRELIQAIRKVYRKSTKAQKGAHLDHPELVTGLKRNKGSYPKTLRPPKSLRPLSLGIP
jgi:hypothetical protein